MSARKIVTGRARPDAAATLRAVGLRRTGPRTAVLELLQRADAPLSHGDLAVALAPAGFDRATVYRNLVDLTRAGLVERSDRGDHVWRFALVRAGEPDHGRQHPHLVCVDCGTNVCLPEVKVKLTAEKAQRRVVKMEVQLRGRCDDCDD